MKRLIIIAFVSAFASFALFGQNNDGELQVSLSTEGTGAAAGAYFMLRPSFTYLSPFFDLSADFIITNDGKYNATESWMGDFYFLPGEGKTAFHWDRFYLEAGYLRLKPVLDTPYELFLNPQALAKAGSFFSYYGDRFSYENRWITVSYRSQYKTEIEPAIPWPDKGVNNKVFTLDLGEYTLGYQESSVYIGRSFDALYFLSPLPSILTNTLMTQGGNPWAMIANDNSLMGMFLEKNGNDHWWYSEFLLDDINLNFLFSPDSKYIAGNLNKLSWSIGGWIDFHFGRIGLYHAGATKYVYGATYADTGNPNTVPYEYTWYPVSELNGTVISPEDNYIGYKYGENNLAFLAVFENTFFPGERGAFDFTGSLEWVLQGQKAPNNPWQEYLDWSEIDDTIQLFGDRIIEHTIRAKIRGEKQISNWLAGGWRLSAELEIGGIFNRLGYKYLPGDPEELGIFKPQQGENDLILSLTLGVSYSLQVF
ncbi:MAG: hypothetical protein KAU17_14225 [Spirochaetales bacterium]|nr:hypothetical protein [Spirochaetales bacterium]